MEAIGVGLSALGGAITSIAVCVMFMFLGLIGAMTFLTYNEILNFEQMKEVLKMVLPSKKNRGKWQCKEQ